MSYSQALDGLIDLLRYLNSDSGRDEVKYLAQDDASLAEASQKMVRRMIDQATPYYWSGSIGAIIDVSRRDMPPWRLMPETLPTPAGYFWFDRPMSAPCANGSLEHPDEIRGLLWMRMRLADGFDACAVEAKRNLSPEEYDRLNPDTVWIWPIVLSSKSPGPHLTQVPIPWPAGHMTPKELDEEFVSRGGGPRRSLAFRHTVLTMFAACLAFIQQRILVQSVQRPERATRKRAAPVFNEEREVRVIELRKRAVPSAPSGEHDPIDWACRWVVSGHWRQQWFPSVQENRPVWITPYIKGPEDKPLKLPTERIFSVVR